jgi:hypothetical protein
MKYSLRSLMIVVLVAPLVLASIYFILADAYPRPLPPITGSVNINGVPASFVLLEFLFNDGTRGAAIVDTDGKFELFDMAMSNQGDFSHFPSSARVTATELKPGKTAIPLRYGDMETTPLSVPIYSDRENTFTLEILAP